MTAALFVVGAVPLILLDTLHNLYTVLDEFSPKRLAPRDTGLVNAMRMAPPEQYEMKLNQFCLLHRLLPRSIS